MDIPKLDLVKFENGESVKGTIKGKYTLPHKGDFLYLVVSDKKLLILYQSDLIYILVDCANDDSFFVLNVKSSYAKVGEWRSGNMVGINGGMTGYIKISIFLKENLSGKEIQYNNLNKYYFQLALPWVEGKADYGLPEVKIHIGGKEQETLREAGAVALTQGKDIYIREESYKEGSEETEKILLHELTHIAQRFEGRRIRDYEEIEEAERESEENERLAEYESDPYYYAKINGKLFYINNKTAKHAVVYAVDRLEEKVREYAAEDNLEMLLKLKQVIGG